MYAVDSVPNPSAVLAQTQFKLEQAQQPLHPVLKEAPVQIPTPPKGLPLQMPSPALDVMKLYSSSECTEARAGAAPNRPVPGNPAQPDKATAYVTALFTPRKQKAELFEAGVLHNAMQSVRLGGAAGLGAAVAVGCALSPVAPHADIGEHAVAPAFPPAQKYPTGQATVVPPVQYDPAGAAHGEMLKATTTVAASAYTPSPGWSAAMKQPPAVLDTGTTLTWSVTHAAVLFDE